jgi:eukaryotic-like serine/threonine-protein kinase
MRPSQRKSGPIGMWSGTVSERYVVVDQIGEGGMGLVRRVRDQLTGEICAMKIIPRTSGVAKLRSEFLALARIAHDNIVRVRDYGVTEAGHDYFTMDYVEGPPLFDAVASIDDPKFYPLIGGILRALAFLHARGVVHADIKPSNILVDGGALATEPLRAARLVDFGLAAAITDPAAATSRGTFPYAAPEVYAGRLDARSDLYAFGVVLYELTTGAKPYMGDNTAEVLVAQRRSPPADPREKRADIPAGLAELILGLLDPMPNARPQTADEVLARLNDIGGTSFAIDDSRPLVDISGALVGRDRDLSDLDERLEAARHGRGGVVLISGEEGIGKSRLMAELKLRTQLAGGAAYAASVAARTGLPFAGIGELVRGLLADAGIQHRRSDALAPLFGTQVEADRLDPGTRYALAEAVAEVVLEAAAEQPLLIEIDDVQDADLGAFELLTYLARSVQAGSILLVLALRRSAAPASKRWRSTPIPAYGAPTSASRQAIAQQLTELVTALPAGRHIELPPLDGTSVHRLVENAFGSEIARELAADLHRSSGGNPAHAAHALQALVERGTIARERGRWILKEELPSIPMPADAVAAACARATALPARTQDVLYAASVLGARFRRDVLAELAGRSVDEVMTALMDAAEARLVGADIGAGWFYFVHHEVAAALYSELDPDERDAHHRRAAQILTSRSKAQQNIPPEALAVHYLAINDADHAASWSLRAAEAREKVRDHHGALEWYQRARPYLQPDSLDAAQVDIRLGDLRSLVKQVPEACEDYRRAYEATDPWPELHVSVAERLGELLRRRGDGSQALTILMKALDMARRHKLEREEARCHLCLGQILMYRADYKGAMEHAIAGHLVARAQADRTTAAELGRLRASIEIYQGDPLGALRHLGDSLTDAEAGGVDVEVAEVQFGIGRAAIHAGDYARAIDSYEKAIPVFEQAGRIEKAASSINNLGAACYYQGDWVRCRESWERFRDLCQRLDEKSELVNALNNLATLYRDLGEMSEAIATLDQAAHFAKAVGHAYMAAVIEGNRGEVLFRQADMAGARACYDAILPQFIELGARQDVIETRRRIAEVDIALGRVNEGLDLVIETVREAQDAGVRFEEGILHRVAAAALRQQGDIESASWFCERSRQMLSELGARFERARADVEAAEIAAAEGKLAESEKLLGQAIDVFAELGARWHLTRARNRLRALRPVGKRGFGGAQGQRGEVLLEVAQAAGRVDLDNLLAVILDKILEVTGFDRGFILLLDADGRPSERMRRTRGKASNFGPDEAAFSGSIVRRVASEGEAVAVTDIADDVDLRDQASVVALGLRQVMCAPMFSRGRVFGIVYVDSRRLPHSDREGDMALLEALAAQAAVAVENARLMAEERRKTELMGILAHEIRNPLAGILGFSKVSEHQPGNLSPEARDLLEHIHRDAQRLRRLVDNVLELTRHEAGDAEWSMGPFDVAAVVENVRASYQAAVRERQIDIALHKDCQPATAMGNPDRIAQVVSNLLGNATKFSPDGSTIDLSVRSELVASDDPMAPPVPPSDVNAWAPMANGTTEREFIRVDVTDRGPGMTTEVRERLFQKFSQGSAKRSKGVGLGLYISREIIDRHGGSIWVDSEPNQGATFSFRIPTAV